MRTDSDRCPSYNGQRLDHFNLLRQLTVNVQKSRSGETRYERRTHVSHDQPAGMMADELRSSRTAGLLADATDAARRQTTITAKRSDVGLSS